MRTTTYLPVLGLAASAAAACNGNDAYCDRRYSEITFAGSHNSGFVGIGPSDNQLTSVTAQLDQGIRFLTTQTHDKDGVIQMCHTSCALLDAGPLQDYLGTVKTWVDGHPDDVVTLLITNGDAIDIVKFDDAFKAVGLDAYTFTPPGTLGLDDWPTLGDLISSNNRVIVFMDYNSDTGKVPYILDEFAYYFETPFDPLEDQLSGCNVDRPAGASADGRMILANHNRNYEVLGINLPDLAHAGDTNSVDSITAQTNTCNSMHGRIPNVVLLDYVSIGQVIDAQNQLNDV
ncbi:PLC-like phosphodiesterase [Xylaria bambusicola]|uniref:PLC-like phosphodiesterase n=1 Tax=Xylaria bambusicola TaxID=326684 RepID=UPI002008C855|nr:PLC-like phosphodiesterase [Xylaria bambusicola]KAI0528230.1 PLC-like phosphodiesterase [Xylaria bambusicola]